MGSFIPRTLSYGSHVDPSSSSSRPKVPSFKQTQRDLVMMAASGSVSRKIQADGDTDGQKSIIERPESEVESLGPTEPLLSLLALAVSSPHLLLEI
jgi:hypothetical protein